MSASNAAENHLMLLLFNNATWPGIGDTIGIVGSTSAGSFFISAYTADPGEAGDQTTNEISYTGYTRPPVARSGAGWAVSGNAVSPVSTIGFTQSTGGTGGTITHFGAGKLSAGAGEIIISGTVAPNIPVSSGVTPQLTTSTQFTVD